MNLLNEIIDHNKRFVESGKYVEFFSDKYPEKKLAILSCMDTRILELCRLGLEKRRCQSNPQCRCGSAAPLGLGHAQPLGGRV